MTKGYILQDTETNYYVRGNYNYSSYDNDNYDLTTDILNASVFDESELIYALQKMSENHNSPCYSKQFIQLTIWKT